MRRLIVRMRQNRLGSEGGGSEKVDSEDGGLIGWAQRGGGSEKVDREDGGLIGWAQRGGGVRRLIERMD